jgi:membrane associated rhomboid family serine protease
MMTPFMTYNRGYPGLTLSPITILIGANVLVFIATSISPELVVRLGLLPATVPNEPWTLITSTFVHSGLFHLLFNMLALFFLGSYLTRLIPNKALLTVYFGGGLLGSIFFWQLGPSLALAVGASGAIFAVGGALAVLMPNLRVFVFPIPVPMPLWIAILGGFAVLSLLSFVAWEAHLGGLVFGALAGYLFKGRRRYL